MNLPKIANNQQQWCCSRGCGACEPVAKKREYSRETSASGIVLESKSETVYVSSCCKAALMLWDDGRQDFVDIPGLDLIESIEA